jgi:hypothetical protein
MATDSAKPVDLPPRPALHEAARSGRELPRISSIQIHRAQKKARTVRHMSVTAAAAGVDRADGIEFIVKLGGPLPARALAPALFIGDVQIAESEAIDDGTLRFFIPHDPRLKVGEKIYFGWIDDRPEDRVLTSHTYDGPQ